MTYPSDCRYSKDHEWVKTEGEACVVGITHYAQDELGEVVFVDLPEVGSSFAAHDEIGSIESVKAVAEVYSPVGGQVVEVNESLEEQPELVNEDPHGKGWLIKLEGVSGAELEELMTADQYEAFLADG